MITGNRFKKRSIATSKLLIAFLFLNCTIIEGFTMYVTLKSLAIVLAIGGTIDFSPLLALIGAVVGEVISFAIYSLKSMKENTKGGIIYEQEIKQQKESDSCG